MIFFLQLQFYECIFKCQWAAGLRPLYSSFLIYSTIKHMFGFDYNAYRAEIMCFKAISSKLLIYGFLSTHIRSTHTESSFHVAYEN